MHNSQSSLEVARGEQLPSARHMLYSACGLANLRSVERNVIEYLSCANHTKKKSTECEFKKEKKKDRIELNALISEYDSG